MVTKVIHTKTFSCDNDHPIVWYTFEEKDFYTKMLEEKELLDMGLKDSIKQKEERTPSEKMQDKLEPIPCPMHEDYDNEKTNA